MAWRRYLACGAGLLLAAGCFSSGVCAEETGPDAITLINGAVMQGTVTGLTSSGLVMNVGTTSRAYPWVALSPGSRFRYDMSYRMNLAGYLSGADIATLTNQPDPTFDPMNPGNEVSEPEPDVITPKATNLFELTWQEAGSVVPKAVRGIDGSLVASSRFWSIRIGTAEKDVVLVARKEGSSPAVSMALLQDGRMVAETPSDEGGGVWSFPARTFSVSLGTVAGNVSLAWRVASEGNRMWMVSGVETTMDGNPVRFSLSGEPLGWLSGADSITPQYLYADPSLRWLIQIKDGEAALAGEIRMGMWRLMPGEDMKLTVAVEIVDEKGETVQRGDVALIRVADGDTWPLNLALTKLTPGAAYRVKASIDLGPGLGRAETDYTFIMPDAQKL